LAHRDLNSIQNGRQVRHDLIGPKPQHPKIVALEPSFSTCVVHGLFGFAMLATVHLDHQPHGQAHEIDKIRPERELPTKSQAVDLLPAKRLPKSLLCIRRICAKLTRASDLTPPPINRMLIIRLIAPSRMGRG